MVLLLDIFSVGVLLVYIDHNQTFHLFPCTKYQSTQASNWLTESGRFKDKDNKNCQNTTATRIISEAVL